MITLSGEHTVSKGDTFSSQKGSFINLGHFKNKSHSLNDFKESFLTHSQDPRQFNHISDNGLAATKFGKGFNRRQASEIANPVASAHQEYSLSLVEKHDSHARHRSDFLKERSSKSGYNLITGEPTGRSNSQKPQGKRICGDGLTNETISRGLVVLKESSGRYFAPHASGHRHEYRQNVLINEGLPFQRCSSLLQLGKSDMVSYGVEDQFSKSDYMKLGETTRYGLVEKRQPGAYTPRKQTNNPSGDAKLVHEWTKTVDVNYSTSRMRN